MLKFIKKILKWFTGHSSEVVPVEVTTEVPEVTVQDSSKKTLWKFIIQTLINILAAILTALGATSCL